MSARARADVVVVGGGIVGAATAYHAARRGARVVLVDKGRIGGEQSGRAWGFVRRQGRPPAAMALMADAAATWASLGAELEADVAYVRAGHLAVAETLDDLARLEAGHRAALAAGVACRLLTAREVRALLPALSGPVAGGLHGDEDGHAEAAVVAPAFARAARARGAEVWPDCTALAVDTRAGRVEAVETDRGRVETAQVVVAAGVWAPRLLEPLGIDIPLRVVRSSVAATRPAPPLARMGVWGPRVAFRQRADGALYLGNGYRGASVEHDLTLASFRHLRMFLPSYRESWRQLRIRVGRPLLADLASRLGRDERRRFSRGPWAAPRAGRRAVRALQRSFSRRFPHLAGLDIERAWAGYIEVTPDLLPVLGPVERPQGLHIAVAAGHGFSMGPIIGRRLADVVVDERVPHDLAPFSASRFRDGTWTPARKIL